MKQGMVNMVLDAAMVGWLAQTMTPEQRIKMLAMDQNVATMGDVARIMGTTEDALRMRFLEEGMKLSPDKIADIQARKAGIKAEKVKPTSLEEIFGLSAAPEPTEYKRRERIPPGFQELRPKDDWIRRVVEEEGATMTFAMEIPFTTEEPRTKALVDRFIAEVVPVNYWHQIVMALTSEGFQGTLPSDLQAEFQAIVEPMVRELARKAKKDQQNG